MGNNRGSRQLLCFFCILFDEIFCSWNHVMHGIFGATFLLNKNSLWYLCGCFTEICSLWSKHREKIAWVVRVTFGRDVMVFFSRPVVQPKTLSRTACGRCIEYLHIARGRHLQYCLVCRKTGWGYRLEWDSVEVSVRNWMCHFNVTILGFNTHFGFSWFVIRAHLISLRI